MKSDQLDSLSYAQAMANRVMSKRLTVDEVTVAQDDEHATVLSLRGYQQSALDSEVWFKWKQAQ